MKKMKSLMCIAGVFLFLFNSCSTDDGILSGNNTKNIVTSKKENRISAEGGLEEAIAPERVKNKLVIRFREQLETETAIAYTKMKQSKRTFYGTIDFEPCTCEDNRIELWTFPLTINVETTLGLMETDEDLEGDFQFLLKKPNKDLWYNGNASITFNASHPAISTTNGGVIIAVIDSGINYNYSEFQNGFLYKGGLGGSCYNTTDTNEEYSGWNFADNTNDPFDDNGHGTVVGSLITKQLDAAGVAYRILPIKVFNGEGKTDYFKIVCGFNYAAKNTDVNIMVSSLGWYQQEQSILGTIIEEVEDEKIIVASAGNAGKNSDGGIGVHFPSGYHYNNVLSVTGTNTAIRWASVASTPTGPTSNTTPTTSIPLYYHAVDLAWYSNSGRNSVDISAPSQSIPFYFNNETYYVNGTSFGNAYAAGKAAVLFNNQSISSLKSSVISSGVVYPLLSNKIKYNNSLE